ncbi:cytidine deaminase [Mollicutes bacterium LVI A0039]|nr:cytidine deaminase [Mollicutes bacterium LVI A0039]
MDQKLADLAIAAKDNSYSPYSNFAVGAAIKLVDGTYIQGTNIENASFGATNCAERSTLFAAYSQGYKKADITAIAVTSNMTNPVPPCCICRQVMLELLELDCPVYMIGKEQVIETTVSDLVPFQFTEDELKQGQV